MRAAPLLRRPFMIVSMVILGGGCLALAAACEGRDPVYGAATSPYPLVITRTGGFAGVNQTIEIDASGAWRYHDARNSASDTAGELRASHRERLEAMLGDPDLLSDIIAASPDGTCADGFQYHLSSAGQAYQFESCGDLGSHLDDLMDLLSSTTPF